MKPSTRVRGAVARCQPGDREDLHAFQRQMFGPASRQADHAAFAWRFERHPLRGPDGPDLWIARRDGQVVGQQCALPMLLRVGPRERRAAWAIDLMVAPPWRLRGVGPALYGAVRDSETILCGLGVSEDARPALRRAGWLDLGRVPRWLRLLRPLEPGQRLLGTWMAGGRLAGLSRFAAPLLEGLDAVLWATARAAGTRFEAIAAFDRRVDALWPLAARHYPVIARRDFAHLAWRYDDSPQAAAYRRFVLLRGGTLLGWAVLRHEREVAVLVDHLCEPRWQGALFVHCLAEARRQGATALACLALPRGTQAVLRSLGFVRRPGPRLVVSADEEIALLSRPGNWFVTEGDSDIDHGPRPAEPIP